MVHQRAQFEKMLIFVLQLSRNWLFVNMNMTSHSKLQNDDRDDDFFLEWLTKKCVKFYFQPVSLTEVSTIANVPHATSKI